VEDAKQLQSLARSEVLGPELQRGRVRLHHGQVAAGVGNEIVEGVQVPRMEEQVHGLARAGAGLQDHAGQQVKGDSGPHFGGLIGQSYMQTDKQPGVVDASREDILLPEEVWSGQLVRANVVPFAWTHTGRRGVSFGLNHLQVIQSEGRQRLDGRPSAGSAFDDGEVDEKGKEPF